MHAHGVVSCDRSNNTIYDKEFIRRKPTTQTVNIVEKCKVVDVQETARKWGRSVPHEEKSSQNSTGPYRICRTPSIQLLITRKFAGLHIGMTSYVGRREHLTPPVVCGSSGTKYIATRIVAVCFRCAGSSRQWRTINIAFAKKLTGLSRSGNDLPRFLSADNWAEERSGSLRGVLSDFGHVSECRHQRHTTARHSVVH